jgi:geranylgeranyl pyrophosphate synthase
MTEMSCKIGAQIAAASNAEFKELSNMASIGYAFQDTGRPS